MLEREIQKINQVIDFKILHGENYSKEARDHKLLLKKVRYNTRRSFLKNLVEKENPERVEDLISLLKEIPEYKEAMKIGVGPKAITGKPDSRCGKIAITEITGGTEGSPKLLEKLSQAGVGTTLAMHASEEHRKEAENACLNVVIAGHISSDSLGMNLFLDELEKKGIEIICSSGLTRFKRF